MSRVVKKWFKDFLMSNLDDVSFTSPGNDEIPFFNPSSNKWENGDTANILLLSRLYLNRDIFIPANRNAFIGKTHINGFKIKIEGRLKVL